MKGLGRAWGMIPPRRRLVAQGLAIIALSWLIVGAAMLVWSPVWPTALPAAARRPAQDAWEGWARLAVIAYIADFLYLLTWLMLRRSRFHDRLGASLIATNLAFAVAYHAGVCYVLWPALQTNIVVRMGVLALVAAAATWGFVELLRSQDAEGPAEDPGALGFESLIRAMPLVVANEAGRIVFASDKAADLVGRAPDDLEGHDLTVLMPERFWAAHRAGLARYLATGEAHVIGRVVPLAARHADGSEVPIFLALTADVYEGRRYFVGAIWRREEVMPPGG